MQIFLARNNVQAGPYTLDELNTMLATGEVVLSDLAWHQGMITWQTLGELTGGQLSYRPAMTDVIAADGTASSDAAADSASTRRVSVAELYGRSEPATTPNKTSQNPVSTPTKDDDKPAWMGRHRTQHTQATNQSVEIVYASIGSRLLAFCLNMVMFILTTLPLQMAIVGSGIDVNQMQPSSMAEYQALGELIAKHISATTIMTTFVMMVSFALIQLALIATRGQSLGKMVVGIRVVDESTHKVPDLGKVIGVRTVLLFLIYQLASVVNVIALILLAVNYFLANTSPKKQGWHDRLAKTIVVKADSSQLNKSKDKQ